MSNKFSFSTIQNFDDHILNSIQGYKILDNNIFRLAEYFLEDYTNCYDIGCSTGRQLKKIKEGYNKKVKYIGIDKEINFSKDFVNSNNLQFLQVDLEEDFVFTNASLILSTFTLQFVKQNKRQEILNNIYKGLNKGGAFIWSEKVFSEHSKIQDILTFQYYDFKQESFEPNQILSKEKDLRSIMKPLTLKENKEMLEKAGFKVFDVFFQNYNFLSILAIK